ncbi:MAG TPA: peptidoglycan-binding domain-containing protein [Hyphomicrobiaceae bacterium]|nr:peptidoglycan-binding domain-containing protein [Hyphomicrobiaceae bacterium]
MSPRWIRSGLAVFFMLCGAFGVNLLLRQPSSLSTGSVPSATGRLQAGTRDGRSAFDPGSTETSVDTVELTRAIQRELRAKGHETGPADGTAGLVTRAAIMAYEADHGLPVTGEPTQALLQHIVLGSANDGLAAARPASAPGPEAEHVIRTVQRSLRDLGFTSGAVDGRLGEETARAIRKFEVQQRMPESGRISGQLVARLGRLAG